MPETADERIRRLERSVRRWRLACLALTLVVVCLGAIGGTFGIVVLARLPDINEMEMLRAQEQMERDKSEHALLAERAALEQAQRALDAERAARQQLEGKGDAP